MWIDRKEGNQSESYSVYLLFCQPTAFSFLRITLHFRCPLDSAGVLPNMMASSHKWHRVLEMRVQQLRNWIFNWIELWWKCKICTGFWKLTPNFLKKPSILFIIFYFDNILKWQYFGYIGLNKIYYIL